MLVVPCPNCGPRNASEFRCAGEYRPRPDPTQQVSDEEWAAYLYTRTNAMGVHTEWWYHSAGCGLWFLAERHTKTNEFTKTYLFGDA